MQNNNDNENLFTQMFGQPSEQPTEPQTQAPQTEPVVEQAAVSTPVPPVQQIQESPKVEEPPSLMSSLNYQQESPTTPSTQPPTDSVITLKPTTQEELDNRKDIKEEAPTTEPIITKFTPNDIPSQPMEYHPTQYREYDEYNDSASSPKGNIILKLGLILFGVCAIIGGWLVIYDKVLSNDETPKTPDTSNTEDNQNNEESSTETKEEEQTPPEVKINFDENLSFYHSLTTNESELYQTEPYTPAKSTGVIRCENIKIEEAVDGKAYFHYYLYYEDYKLKMTIHQEAVQLYDQTAYQTTVNSLAATQKLWADKEGIKYVYQTDPTSQTIVVSSWFNLAYGNYFVADRNSGIFYYLLYDYNDNIKTTMGTMFGNHVGNLACSTVVTTTDMAQNNEI